MKEQGKFTDIYAEWAYIESQYGQDPSNFPFRVILKNCQEHRLATEITGLYLVEGGDGLIIKLFTTDGEITIDKNCPWQLAFGQTSKKQTIFTHHLE